MELSVYDNEEQCTFIILGDAGKELTGRKASELIDAYVQVIVVLLIDEPIFIILTHIIIIKSTKLINKFYYIRKMVEMRLSLKFHCHSVLLTQLARQRNSGSRSPPTISLQPDFPWPLPRLSHQQFYHQKIRHSARHFLFLAHKTIVRELKWES